MYPFMIKPSPRTSKPEFMSTKFLKDFIKTMYRFITTSFRGESATIGTGDIALTRIPPDVIQAEILKRLNEFDLASLCCVSKQLYSICSDDLFWKNTCNSTWPSTTDPRVQSVFPSAHRSFYLDSGPSFHHQLPKETRLSGTRVIISAVDIHYRGQAIYSKVVETETAGDGFLNHPLTIQLLDPTETVPIPTVSDGIYLYLGEDDLTMSWIVIDPDNKRAVNVPSFQAVESWFVEDYTAQLRFAKVAETSTGELVQCAVVISCEPEATGELHLKDVKLSIEDQKGETLSGAESLQILQAAMEGRRRRINWEMEEYHYKIFSNEDFYRRELGLWEKSRANLMFNCIKPIILAQFFIWLGTYSYWMIFFAILLTLLTVIRFGIVFKQEFKLP